MLSNNRSESLKNLPVFLLVPICLEEKNKNATINHTMKLRYQHNLAIIWNVSFVYDVIPRNIKKGYTFFWMDIFGLVLLVRSQTFLLFTNVCIFTSISSGNKLYSEYHALLNIGWNCTHKFWELTALVLRAVKDSTQIIFWRFFSRLIEEGKFREN